MAVSEFQQHPSDDLTGSGIDERARRSAMPNPSDVGHRTIWIAVAIVLIICGTTGAVLGANVVARNDRQGAHAAFTASAADVASTLTLALQHEEDLVVGARSYIVGNPTSSQAAFKRWTTAVEAFARYPELEGGGEVALVPASGLAAFAARKTADPPSPLPAGSSFEVVPPGPRPFYCLVALSLARKTPTVTAVPAGFDYCAAKSSLSTAFFTARDSGRNAYLPYQSGPTTELVIETPIYRGGGVPATIAERDRAFLGAFGTTLIPQVVLSRATRGHPGVAVELRYGSALSHVVFRSGVAASGGQTATIGVSDGWTIRVIGARVAAGVLGDSKALGLVIGGIAVSLLLGLLVFVLGTGRSRALVMVREKTGEISYRALHDSLTGLPNRTLVFDRAERMLARARRDPRIIVAALYIDIDRFKYVNDTFGHGAGDHLLQTVSKRLQAMVRDQDTVGRLGGDEFVVLLDSATSEAPPALVAKRVLEALRRPVVLEQGERPFASSVSVGIAVGQRATVVELLRDADLALYTAKAAGKNRAVLFQPSMTILAEDHRRLELDLEEAIEESQFFLLYQPIMDLNRGSIVGVEALIRWRHPRRGVVEPDDFIPLAEETGLIMPIGRWVIDEGCRQAAVWAAGGHRIGVSVNVSAYQLDRDGLLGDVRRALESSGIEPSSLTLEITETALMRDVATASERLREIKALGVRIAIDDFGTGSSSLAYLRQFSVDSLKIDQTFIAGMTDSRESAGIIHALVELGKLLEIDTLAEGIEEPEQLAQLQDAQCDLGQGFLFAQPLDSDGIERFLARNSTDSTASTIL